MTDRDLRNTCELSRRQFLAMATAMGASAAWAGEQRRRSRIAALERRDLYPEGVASGDPDANSVLLWTRRPFSGGSRGRLRVEVSEDDVFTRVVATVSAKVQSVSDWTCRVLVGNLHPARVYWYRFIDDDGHSSRIGRTLTAPTEDDARPIRFAFASCQNANMGAQHAYRRMIFEDERAPEAERLGFVLHLGDFYYECVWYPEDRPQGYRDRHLRDIVRYDDGKKVNDFHIPTTLDDYRAIYRAYLHDPDLQDARARWPFICIWDNGEFCWEGWQSIQIVDGKSRPAQSRKVAANQSWFEFQPARIIKSSGPSLDRFSPPDVIDTVIDKFDNNGLGQEPNNLVALGSLTGYRALRWGRNVELIITDQRSYCCEMITSRPEVAALVSNNFTRLFPPEVLEILDAGRTYADDNPPASIRFGTKEIPNFRERETPYTILGAEQKEWFLRRLRESRATWKIWGNTIGTFDARVDLLNLPVGLTERWPGSGYATCPFDDYGTAYLERAEIYSTVRNDEISGFVTVSGNSHSFWAGLAARALPPQPFEPVGVAFVTGAISSVGFAEYIKYTLADNHPLRALYLVQRSEDSRLEPTCNILFRHGVRSCLEYQQTGDLERARSLSNPDLAPHLSFLDLDGHGYATVRASSDVIECEFVCIPTPIERSREPNGGPLVYRVVHRTALWKPGETPRLEQRVVEGNPALSL